MNSTRPIPVSRTASPTARVVTGPGRPSPTEAIKAAYILGQNDAKLGDLHLLIFDADFKTAEEADAYRRGVKDYTALGALLAVCPDTIPEELSA